jgi:4-diphosphocytidyl-2-C-methyl-D-erythritol kinase
MTATLATLAPAKINVCLFLGPTRPDGRHELVSVMQSVSLADRVTLASHARQGDDVHCPGVAGPNLAEAAVAGFRAATGWNGPAVHIEIEKRIPVAAGMAGGSADAGAVLRLLARAAGGVGEAALHDVAAALGADVPAQVRPGRVLATGAGERIERLAPRPAFGVLVLPSAHQLSTPAVFREADRLGLPRDGDSLAERLAAVRMALPDLPPELVVNELEPAARSLCPAIDDALGRVRAAGADVALVSGSGPTVLGLFADPAATHEAARELGHLDPAPVACVPVDEEFAAVAAT